MSMVITSIFLRPMRSPKWPKMKPPSGRVTKPAAKVANEIIVPTSGSKVGKNWLLNTSAAIVP